MIRNRALGGLLAALLVLTGSATAVAEPTHRAQVVGGAAASTSAWPFIAALIEPGPGSVRSRHFCGGSLVAPTWVLTAGHCAQVLQSATGPTGTALVGRFDLDGTGGDERGIRAIHRHPGWSGELGTGDDIALLELDRPSGQPAIPMMKVADEPAWDGTSDVGTVAGWGSTIATHGGYPAALVSAPTPIYADTYCERFIGARYTSLLQLCGGTTRVATCDGDSGGPLVAGDRLGRRFLVGIVSFGFRPCNAGPGFYTRVSGYTDWLAETMGGTTPTTPTTPTTTAPVPSAAYALLAADGTVHAFGSPGLGSAGACKAGRSCVDLAARPGGGYWVSRGSCELAGFGPVPALRSPVTEERCSIAAHPSGKGLWALTPSGRVFAVGAGAVVGQPRPRPKATWSHVEARPQGDGYWVLASDGAVSAFGAAKARPQTGGKVTTAVALAPTASGDGYWLAGRDGSVAAFGDARFAGAAAGRKLGGPIVGIQPTSTGAGYWLFGADGAVLGFGDAKVVGSAVGRAGPVVAAVRR